MVTLKTNCIRDYYFYKLHPIPLLKKIHLCSPPTPPQKLNCPLLIVNMVSAFFHCPSLYLFMPQLH